MNSMKPLLSSSGVIIFMRAPFQGKVKTRLAKTIGDENAAEFYRLCAQTVIAEIGQLGSNVAKYIFLAEPTDQLQTDDLVDLEFKVEIQEGQNLGQRLLNAFKRVFHDGIMKAVIVASDVPDLSADIVEKAIGSLDDSDVVIGPCYDGGYYLIGIKEPHQELFRGVSWGTEQVCQQTLVAADKSGLAVGQLSTLIDIDTEEDLRWWSEVNGSKRPALMDFLKVICL